MVEVNSTEILFEFDMLPKPAGREGVCLCVWLCMCVRERMTFQKRCWSGIKNLLSEIKLNLIHENHGMIQDYKEI